MSSSTSTSTAANYNFTPPAHPSRYLRALLAYAQGMDDLDYDAVMALFDDSLAHRYIPASLDRPVRSKEAYAEYFKIMPALFGGNKLNITIHEVVEEGHKIAIHCSSQSQSANGTPYANEYALFIHYVPLPAGVDPYSPLAEGEELPKMTHVKEFMDSASSAKFFETEAALYKGA